MKPQEFSSFSLVRTHSIRCTSVCTMEQITSCLGPSWSHYQSPSTRIHFLLKMRKFFLFLRFSKFIRSHVAFLILWHHRFQEVPFWRVHTNTRKQCFQREIIASEKFHFCITLTYFDQSCLSLVTISNSLHSFTDGSSSKVVTGWRKCRNPQSRNWKID